MLKKPEFLSAAIVLLVTIVPHNVYAGTYTYNRPAAVNYALTWCGGRNPNYVSFQEDCTNFVSQSLLAGGWPEKGKYNYQSSSSWYYDGGSYPLFTYTWAGVQNFYNFINIGSARGHALSLAHKPWNQYFRPGDLVQADWNRDGIWDHTMIIVNVTSTDMIVVYHSNDSCGTSLTQLMNQNPNAFYMATLSTINSPSRGSFNRPSASYLRKLPEIFYMQGSI